MDRPPVGSGCLVDRSPPDSVEPPRKLEPLISVPDGAFFMSRAAELRIKF